MALSALDTSAAHPLYLYIVFAVCVVAAIALLIGATLSRRNSSWRRQMQQQGSAPRRPGPAYPVEAAPPALAEPAPTVDAKPVAVAASKPAPRRTATSGAAKKTAVAKKTAAKKAAAKTTTRTNR